jgi:hypothetical protein
MRWRTRGLSCGFAFVACAVLAGCRVYCPPRPEQSIAMGINAAPPARVRDSRVPSTPPTDEDEAWLVERECSGCHTIERLMSVRLGWRGWRGEVGHMVQNGAVLTVPEQQRIVDYLGLRDEAAPMPGTK